MNGPRTCQCVLPMALAVAASASVAGCSRAPEMRALPPPEVGVITVTPRPATLTRELPGRTSAYRVAEVRARVSGVVLKRLFVEGSDVKQGQVLYQIDPAPYRAAFDNANGALARAEANAAAARAQARRYEALVQTRAVSQQEYDDATATLKADDADVATAKAALETAAINLGYTNVVSPVSGRIGRSEVTEGAYVQDTQATLLATVQELDQMYVDLTQSSAELLRLKRALAGGGLQSSNANRAGVRLILEDGSRYPDEGALQFADVTVDLSTGSVILRALFPNGNGDLLPGMFVRAEIVEAENPSAILVPQSAVTRNLRGEPTVFVVGSDSRAELRPIQTERTVGNEWLVSDGLTAGERVIVDGLQRVRPGMPVSAVGSEVGSAKVALSQ